MELINTLDETLLFNTETIRIIGTYEEPWFVAKDICQILDLVDVSVALRKIPDDWKDTKVLPTLGGNQNMRIINEAGLYRLIMRSNKPIVEKFQYWVCSEVLPSLRKKGEYKMNEEYQLKLKDLEEELKFKDEENEKLTNLLQKKKSNFKKGLGIYIGKNILEPEVFKVGISVNVTERSSGLSTGTTTDFVMEKCWYTKFSRLIEDAIKVVFSIDRISLRKEFYKITAYDDIVIFIESMYKFYSKYEPEINIPTKKEEKIEEFEKEAKVVVEVEEFEEEKIISLVNEPEYVIVRKSDTYIHLPSICKYYGKTYNSYAHSTKNKWYLEKEIKNNPEIIKYSSGANKELQGNWGHSTIAIHLATWISEEIGEKVSRYIDTHPELKDEKSIKMEYNIQELMKATNKKEKLQHMAHSLGLASSVSKTRRQLADSIIDYLSKCEVYTKGENYYKNCDKCLKSKMMIEDNFVNEFQFGYMNTCKICYSNIDWTSLIPESTPHLLEKTSEEIGILNSLQAICNGCKQLKPLSEYHKNGNRLATNCKFCMSVYRKINRKKAKV